MEEEIVKRIEMDYSLYLVTDRTLLLGRDILDVVEKAINGGATVVQLREKEATTREFLSIGKKVKKLLAKRKVPLIVNDRIDIAMALDSDGVHLGNEDFVLFLI